MSVHALHSIDGHYMQVYHDCRILSFISSTAASFVETRKSRVWRSSRSSRQGLPSLERRRRTILYAFTMDRSDQYTYWASQSLAKYYEL